MDPAGESLAIDVLRHRPQIREGTLEMLIVALIQWAQRHNFQTVNLGAGFPELQLDAASNGRARAALEDDGDGQVSERLQAVRVRFKPRWRPRYLVYPGATSLPIVWTAVARERSKEHWLWNLLAHRSEL